jgi:hypothetical protein
LRVQATNSAATFDITTDGAGHRQPGRRRSVTVTGAWFRKAYGLKSTKFHVTPGSTTGRADVTSGA